jgi:hypothetical protein
MKEPVGSNPTLSAKYQDTAPLSGRFVFVSIKEPIKNKTLRNKFLRAENSISIPAAHI